MKRILIIGQGDSFLLTDTVRHLRQHDPELCIALLPGNSNYKVSCPQLFDEILKPSKLIIWFITLVTRINIHAGFKLLKYPLRRFIRKRINDFDVIHIHFFNKNLLSINPLYFSNTSAKKIITFWGSDFYKRSENEKNKMRPYIEVADTIVFANEMMRDTFLLCFTNCKNKIRIVKFGLSVLDEIEIQSDSKVKKNKKGESVLEKLNITIGYSSHPDHHHIPIVEKISSYFSPEQKKEFRILLPMTYGDEAYRQKVSDFMKKIDIEYTLYDYPLSTSAIANIRLESDVFIHLRDTDQLSGSFQEHLFAGNVVITGSWLPYSGLLDNGAVFFTIDSLDLVAEKLGNVIKNLDDLKLLCKVNRKVIGDLSSWENVIYDHQMLYY